jgi:hypothetical protein
MADIPEDVVLIRYGKAVLALTPAEFRAAIKRGKYIRRCDSTERRAEKRLEASKREGGHDPY